MKLVFAVINAEDSNKVTNSLIENKFYFTKLSSKGGFLSIGNTTIMIGVEDEKIDELLNVIKEHCKERTEIVPSCSYSVGMGNMFALPIEVKVGGATIFILDVEKMIKI